jgi:NAD(P)H-hydrate epimerase
VRPEPTSRLPLDLYTAERVRGFDRVAIETHGVPGATLMERSGTAAYRALRAIWPEQRRVTAVCGAGNNGGDGYVVARLARQAGLEARVLAVGDPGRLTGDARAAADAARGAGVPVEGFTGAPLASAGVVVDALFGTGLDRPLEGIWAEAVRAMAGARPGVLAVDVPSGVHADSGRVLGVAVPARATVTFVALKRGLFTGEGPAHTGQVLFHDLGVPGSVRAGAAPDALRLDAEALARAHLPPRGRTGHKGCYGHVLVVGGDHGYAGAARLAAEAAARVGAGLVTIATRAAHAPALIAPRPELMARGVETPEGLLPLLERASVVAIGPGLGRGAWGRALAEAVLASALPRVVDADALAYLPAGTAPAAVQVVTPHPGEAGRLLGVSSAEVQADRFAALDRLLATFGGVVVLKGAGTLVGEAGVPAGVCDGGNPGMASGGMGDVLTGVIAGLAAQGLALPAAAPLGVCLHARAADLAAGAGERGLLARDLLAYLRRLANPGRVPAGSRE